MPITTSAREREGYDRVPCQEIARQLAENGTVDITGIVNDFKQTAAPPAPAAPAVTAPAPKAKKRAPLSTLSEDKENLPPGEG